MELPKHTTTPAPLPGVVGEMNIGPPRATVKTRPPTCGLGVSAAERAAGFSRGS
jgi:hypothetical protein